MSHFLFTPGAAENALTDTGQKRVTAKKAGEREVGFSFMQMHRDTFQERPAVFTDKLENPPRPTPAPLQKVAFTFPPIAQFHLTLSWFEAHHCRIHCTCPFTAISLRGDIAGGTYLGSRDFSRASFKGDTASWWTGNREPSDVDE